MQYWPEVRWWLAEGFHTDETLLKDIQIIHDAGFGAVEFLALEEHGADSSKYGWGSEEWVHDTHTIIRETTARGMGVSFTSGTNWSTANLPDFVHKPDDKSAAKELAYTIEHLSCGQNRSGLLKKAEPKSPAVKVVELIAVVAIKKMGEQDDKQFLCKDSAIILTDNVLDGALDWTASDGDWALFAFWMHGTGQTTSPSVSVSYTVNYMDRYGIDKLTQYWDDEVLTPELREYINKNDRVQMYMDSLELTTSGNGGQFWGYHLIDEFKKRRGYDLTPYLPFIMKVGGMMGGMSGYQYFFETANDDNQYINKLRNDLYQTMTELYIDNMLKPMQSWLYTHNMTLRAEISYGMPFEISIPGKYVDGIETESFEFASQIEPYRNLAGPAHLFNRIYSSETGAAILNYRMNLDFYTQIIYTQFAAGVTKNVLHGYSSIAGSEDSTAWPGHEGMMSAISERFGSRQPAFRHYNDWTSMLARNQMILRQGKPRRDIGILRLDYNFNNLFMGGSNEVDIYENKMMRAHEGVYWQDMSLQDKGYTWDYFAPQILEDEDISFSDGVIAPHGPGYQALIIYQESLPLSSAKQILSWAEQGLPVVFVNNATEQIRPLASVTHGKAASKSPFNTESDTELDTIITKIKSLDCVKEVDNQADTIKALESLYVLPRAALAEPNENILTYMREDDGIFYLYVYNYMYTNDTSTTVTIEFNTTGKPYRVDCWEGNVNEIACYDVKDACTAVPITLNPGESTIIMLDTSTKDEIYVVDTDAHNIIINNNYLAVQACSSGTYTTSMSDGTKVKSEIIVSDDIILDKWKLTVEDWDEGEKKTISEDRGLGFITKEAYYETKKTLIDVGETSLKPWKDISAVGEKVSGVGYYSTSFTLPDNWSKANGAFLQIGTTYGNTAAIYVNGKKASAYDFNRHQVDVSKLLIPGENKILIEVSSTLHNRMSARGFHAKLGEMMQAVANNPQDTPQEDFGMQGNFMYFMIPCVEDYGLGGEVCLVTYATVPLT